MPAAVPIADHHRPEDLRRLARGEREGRVRARLLGIANALDGLERRQAARLAGLDSKTLQRWIERYNSKGVNGLHDRPRCGRPCGLSEGQQASLRAMVLRGPDPERNGVASWRIVDLCDLVERRFGVGYSQTGMLRLVKSLELSWQKARPRAPLPDRRAQAAFKKTCPR